MSLQENVLQSCSRSQSLSPDKLFRYQSSGLSPGRIGPQHHSPGDSQRPERVLHQQPSFSPTAQSGFSHRHSLGRLLPQTSLPKSGSAHPHESRQDNSEAAHRALLNEEAERMLRHVSQDGTSCQAGSLLRTPQHLIPLVAACQTARELQTLDLSHNSLSDSALEQLEGKLVVPPAQVSLAHVQLPPLSKSTWPAVFA